MKRAGRIDLDLGDAARGDYPRGKHAAIRNLSGIADAGPLDGLFVCDDEGTSIRFLAYGDDGAVHDRPRDLKLGKLLAGAGFPLETTDGDGAPGPKGLPREMDLEGLAYDEGTGRLWFTGSHTRSTPDAPVEPPTLRTNRLVLAYVVAKRGAAGRPLAFVPKKDGRTAILDVLASGPLAPYALLATKRNGPDIEGLAARGDTVYLGLRGPVIEGLATIVRVDFGKADEATVDHPRRLEVARWHQFFLPLGNKGVRDLLFDGDRLLILTGMTGDLQTGAGIWAWTPPDAIPACGHATVDVADVRELGALDSEPDGDAPECFEIVRHRGKRRLLVVRDNPDKKRIERGRVYRAELYKLP